MVEDLSSPIDLTIHSKCPEKWLLIDLETSQMYRGMKEPGTWGKWRRLKKHFAVQFQND